MQRILPLVLVAQSLEHLTCITEVMGSIPLGNSENLFRGFFIHCQEKITNVDIDKANKTALVGAEDNLLPTHVVTKLQLLFKHCPSFGGTKCAKYTEIGKAPYKSKVYIACEGFLSLVLT